MARKSRAQIEEAAIDMTPMLDVTFIMLIFFITTSSFVKEAGGPAALLPQANMAHAKPEANVFVNVTSDNLVYVDKRSVEPGAVRQVIEAVRTETPIGAVVIQADKRSKTGIVIQVMDQVKMAGVENVSLAATVE